MINKIENEACPKLKYQVRVIGAEQTPIIIINNFVDNIGQLIELGQNKNVYKQDPANFYPGVRAEVPADYHQHILTQLPDIISKEYSVKPHTQWQLIQSAYSLATTAEADLRPIQMLPHFDNCAENQYAIVHYLCEKSHGGTGFYQHKTSGFERINAQRQHPYRLRIKQEAIAAQLHKVPQYIRQQHPLFDQIYCVEAEVNKAIIYPSNLLHSGQLNPQLINDPKLGRLTISSFITVN